MILVIGCGYIGKAFLALRGEAKRQSIACTTSQNKVKELKYLASEVLVLPDEENLRKAMDQSEIALILVAPSTKEEYEKVYLGTAKWMKNYLASRRKKLHLLVASSTFVYASSPKETVTEDELFVSCHPKASLLKETEDVYLSTVNEFVSVAILRLGGIYGPGRELFERALAVSGKQLPGSGNEPTNHIHRDDAVAAFWHVIDQKLTGIYNVTSDFHPIRKDLYKKLCSSLGVNEPTWNPNHCAEHGCGCKVDSQKLKKTGFTFLHSNGF
ncbi:MAG: NAD-dependent epimerase/dehydratase family protein [Chlamydiae bacterium]|nr:NAD-dependent epimerase/dehydratase family protein [Chlamydiota bacterium]